MATPLPDRLPFAKLSGAGNDFVLVDGMDGRLDGADLAELARLLCRPHFSIGADGLIVLVRSTEADFAWRFHNADGSAAEMCGNGARCAARFARMKGIALRDEMSFLTLAGRIEARVTEDGAIVTLTAPKDYRERFDLPLPGGTRSAWFVDSGVPHVVVPVEGIDSFDVAEEGRAARFHPLFAPKGTNADFVAKVGENRIRARVYERGVEAETLACGTGAVASAIVAAKLGWAKSPVEVVTSGGSLLLVHFAGTWGNHEGVRLEGDARLIYEGEWTGEALE
jgi:diaminopimelate epimerase